ncbi:hypothetical protein CBS147332_478 [Penicillium roqueforti]|nr:hypothetical protein CBS147332_478 [Penicillium roqueforti]
MGVKIAQHKMNRALTLGFELFIKLRFQDWGRPTGTGTYVQNCVRGKIFKMLFEHYTCLFRKISMAPPGSSKIPQLGENQLLVPMKPRWAPILVAEF